MQEIRKKSEAPEPSGGGYFHKERDSNLELLRIIGMLAIVAHHSVVNSGITECYDFSNITGNMIFLQLWGMWGKTAINIFVLITGYFMCTSKLTWKRFFKIWGEAKFYKVIFFIIFVIAGYEVITARSLFQLFFGYLHGINASFTASFLAFYLFIPFLNKFIASLEKKDLQRLLALLLGIFTITSTFFFNSSVFHYVFWYITLYLLAAYIRLYPFSWMEKKKIPGIMLIVSILLAYASVLVVDFIGVKFGFTNAYYMVSDSNKLLAFTTGLSIFLLFKNLHIKNNKVINKVAGTTFGVLCIHANSDAMREWLWNDLLNVPSWYSFGTGKLILFMAATMFGIFIVCSLIDQIRIFLVERPVFNWINRHDDDISNVWNKICKKFNSNEPA